MTAPVDWSMIFRIENAIAELERVRDGRAMSSGEADQLLRLQRQLLRFHAGGLVPAPLGLASVITAPPVAPPVDLAGFHESLPDPDLRIDGA